MGTPASLTRILPLLLAAALILAVPALAECTDTDGGQDPYVKGTVTSDKQVVASLGSPVTDLCMVFGEGSPSGTVVEFYCDGDTAMYDKIACTDECTDGACITSGVRCEDSDGGKDYFRKGEIHARVAGDVVDYCESSMPGEVSVSVHEFSCEGIATFREEIHPCAKGCENGACIPDCPQMTKTCPDGTPLEVKGDCTFPECPEAGLCTDSDGGKVYGTYGVATSTWKPREDYPYSLTNSDGCIPETNTLMEGYCRGAFATHEEHPCSQGCQNGACIGEPGCSIEGAACSAKEGLVCCAGLSCELLPDKDQDVGNCVMQEKETAKPDGGIGLFTRFVSWLRSLFG